MSDVWNAESEAKNRDSSPGDLVVIDSSAGDVEALSILVSKLPADFPAPIVIAQYLDPSRPSTLDAILRRHTTLPVELIASISPLEKGKVYVVPSNRLVTIEDGHFKVQEDQLKRQRPRLSVDVLLTSAAGVYGERLIAVILTGSGSDGGTGAVEVKNAGGMVIVQNLQTARHPSMPLALPPTAIDFEADVEQIGPLLYDLLTGIDLPRTEERTEDTVRSILETVSRQASIDFRPYKTSTILRRIVRRMTITRNRTLQGYAEYLKTRPEEVSELVRAFLINVTQFFRDPDVFDYLKNEILPKLLAQARTHDRVLRLWSAGCATGEEPYSLAMLLTDLLGAKLSDWSVKIFGTDLDERAIDFARKGLYSENMLKGVPLEYRKRFFERGDHGFRISKTLRQMVIFGHHDLNRSAPFPRTDLVLCRNVLIYFTPGFQEYVLNQFAFSLNPGGYLFLGKAETVQPSQLYYELINKHWKVYQATGSAPPIASRPNLGHHGISRLEGRANNDTAKVIGKPLVEPESLSPQFEIGQLRRLNELLLRFLPVGIVVIDRSYHVATANGSARRLLGLRDLTGEQDFLHAVRGIPYTTIRAAIDGVFRERNAITLPEIELDLSAGGNGRFITISIALMQMEAGLPDLAVLSVTDVTEQVQTRRQLEAVQLEQAQLMHELSGANKRLNDVNKELLDANEELQVAKEELVLTHEELQATVEEFETTNEELLATNEELENNYEELLATNEELETTNEELRARTTESQDLNALLQNEQVRLYAIDQIQQRARETAEELERLKLIFDVEITEQVQARQEVERLNKLKDEFLSLASHELRTPLTSILGDAQLAQRDLKRLEAIASTETQAKGIQQAENNLDRIIHQAKRIGRLIDEMLDITRIHSDTFVLKTSEDVNLVEFVRRVVEQLKAITDRSIVLETNEDVIQGTFDADRIEQVLNNLIDNAVKYSPPDKPVMVGVERQSNEAVIWVRDQGPGISEEEQELIFKRFYRAQSENASETEGLGLGLYIAHEIVIRHGGRVWLESQPGEGSTFYFSLPLANQE